MIVASVPGPGIEAAQKAHMVAVRARLMSGRQMLELAPPKAEAAPLPPMRAKVRARLGFIFEAIQSHRGEGQLAKPYDALQKAKIVIRASAKKHGVNLSDMKSARRFRPAVTARQEAMWRIHKKTSLSLPTIGQLFERHHTTVLHSIRRHKRLLRDLEQSNG